MMLFHVNKLAAVSWFLLVAEALSSNIILSSLVDNVITEIEDDKLQNMDQSIQKKNPFAKINWWLPTHYGLPLDEVDASRDKAEKIPSQTEPGEVNDNDIINKELGEDISIGSVLQEYFKIIVPEVEPENLPEKRNRERRSTDSAVQSDIFSPWGEWTACMSPGCGMEGKRVRNRKCNDNSPGSESSNLCKYRNMVAFRSCFRPPCPTTETAALRKSPFGWSQWTAWENCSATCEKSGWQTRNRRCQRKAKNKKCTGKPFQKRLCQHSTGCPKWEGWTPWSSCSETCGTGGVIFRTRSCIIERYLRHETTEDVTENRSEVETGVAFTFVNKGGFLVHVIDKESMSVNVNLKSVKKVIDLGSGFLVEEIVSSDKCESEGEVSEEPKECENQKACPSVWGAWQAWSPCSASCGSGIGRTERECIHDPDQNPCIGGKYLYRRCYSPPCWGPWINVAKCTEPCGVGVIKRRRQCQMTLPTHPPFNLCQGSSIGYINCNNRDCPGGQWSEWSKFSECTATCNLGLKLRNRTCDSKECVGEKIDLVRCNTEPCPVWSKWGDFSCCNVTCGQGYRLRKRACFSGRVELEDSLCAGAPSDIAVCYREPCEGNHTAVLTGQQCGIRLNMNLKNTVKLRIFGGKKASGNDWPWQASWQHRNFTRAPWEHCCGASLIHQRWVVIAGHCIEESVFFVDKNDPGLLWSIVLGTLELYANGSRYFVDRVYLHTSYYRGKVTKNDIALLKLRQMVAITDTVSPICMPEKSEPKPGELCVITGFGITEPGGNKSKYLLEASIPIMKFSDCLDLGDYYRVLLERKIHMCAGNPIITTADSCMGDSGGPLVCENTDHWYLIGLTSFSFADCGTPGHVGIYTPVNAYESWIRGIVRQHTYENCSITMK